MYYICIVDSLNTKDIFSISTEEQFNTIALEIFRFQAAENKVYNDFLNALKTDPYSISDIYSIPFLPISFFKSHEVMCGQFNPEIIFSSSGTTGMVQSRHPVKKLEIYEESFLKGFEYFYGDISSYTVLALLPSYLEREGSSLIYMVDELIKQSQRHESGYYLYNHEDLYNALIQLRAAGRKVILIGVTYALLDFIEQYRIFFPELIVMETGGMKGRRKEMIREELHKVLCDGFGIQHIHSEYGMTEMLSQGYSKGEGIFECPPWMKVLTRDVNDPLSFTDPGSTGGVNVIDLANIYSCSFIATQDLGKVNTNGQFEIMGRFDNSDIRGCNLLVQ